MSSECAFENEEGSRRSVGRSSRDGPPRTSRRGRFPHPHSFRGRSNRREARASSGQEGRRDDAGDRMGGDGHDDRSILPESAPYQHGGGSQSRSPPNSPCKSAFSAESSGLYVRRVRTGGDGSIAWKCLSGDSSRGIASTECMLLGCILRGNMASRGATMATVFSGVGMNTLSLSLSCSLALPLSFSQQNASR